MTDKITKTPEQWQQSLTDEQFRVTRQAHTERPFTGIYWDETSAGTYRCVCCKTPLFRSDTKFDAGCGWPSFYDSLDKSAVLEKRDMTHGMVRTEVVCAQCDAHLGHLFDDGPEPSGLRYCINSASLDLAKDAP
ncbi:peptide-methionine (R)-S-oxide reductase MsrB [Reinekea sp.]|uniref:peptide-methionine (R)-S-oxide reductase MsrB n=1 Tax=Reinekea sp. TaxID=1970455 RepID=UPI002A807186|nr:peptide-methionine (R)-S-oxide reductase MsrB [Reinekea sp.]